MDLPKYNAKYGIQHFEVILCDVLHSYDTIHHLTYVPTYTIHNVISVTNQKSRVKHYQSLYCTVNSFSSPMYLITIGLLQLFLPQM